MSIEALRALESQIDGGLEEMELQGMHDAPGYRKLKDAHSKLAALLTTRQEVAPVAFAIELADGSIGALGWVDYSKFDRWQSMTAPAAGARYVFAYRGTGQTSDARDAARYRWLTYKPGFVRPHLNGQPVYINWSGTREALGEAIDAAMRQEACDV